MKVDKVILLTMAIFAVIFIGEFCTVSKDIHSYDSSAKWGEGYVEYSVYASGSEVYDALLMDNHGYESVNSLQIYVDGNYWDNWAKAGVSYVDQGRAYHEISVGLGYRNFTDIEKCDDSKLEKFLNDTKNNPMGKGLLVLSYELPSTVYDGTDDCLLIKWVENGGNLYWFGSEIGAYSKSSGGVTRIPSNQELFFGTDDCICKEKRTANSEVNHWTKDLSLKNSMLRYGVNLAGATNEYKLSAGFETDGYSTISMVSKGNGSVYVFSEAFENKVYDDVAQIIASGINPRTTLETHQTGTVTRGTETGKIVFTNDDPHLYIYIGGYYTVYGRAFR